MENILWIAIIGEAVIIVVLFLLLVIVRVEEVENEGFGFVHVCYSGLMDSAYALEMCYDWRGVVGLDCEFKIVGNFSATEVGAGGSFGLLSWVHAEDNIFISDDRGMGGVLLCGKDITNGLKNNTIKWSSAKIK